MATKSKRAKILRGGKPKPGKAFDPKAWAAANMDRLVPILESYLTELEEQHAKRAEKKRRREEADRIDAARPEGAPLLLRDLDGCPVDDAARTVGAPVGMAGIGFLDGSASFSEFEKKQRRDRVALEVFARSGGCTPEQAYARADEFVSYVHAEPKKAE